MLGKHFSINLSLMRRFTAAITVSILLSQTLSHANAGLNAQIDLSNPRVVPIFGSFQQNQIPTTAGWSGFLYSPRIVLSAAHSNYNFDSNNNRQSNEPPFITVGKPNSSAKDMNNRVKVIKSFVGDYRKGISVGGLDDFIVYVLERDLVSIEPAQLMTAAIEKELVTTKSEVRFHGYGEYRDRCKPGETNPCKKDFNNPDQSTSELPRVNLIRLANASDLSWIGGQLLSDLENETLISTHKACPGDSGGPITTTYKGALIYLGQGLNGANVFACGAGNSRSKFNDGQSFGHFSPVYKHLDLIKAAEDFIKASSTTQTKASITCTKGQLIKKVSGTNPKCPKGYKKK